MRQRPCPISSPPVAPKVIFKFDQRVRVRQSNRLAQVWNPSRFAIRAACTCSRTCSDYMRAFSSSLEPAVDIARCGPKWNFFFLTLTHTRLEAATSSRRRCFAYPVATLCIFPVFDSGSEFPSPAGFCEMCTPLSGPVCDGTRITPSFAIAFTLRSRVDHTFLLRTRVIWVYVFVHASTLLEPVYSMQVHVQSCSLPRFYKHVLRPCTHSAAFFFISSSFFTVPISSACRTYPYAVKRIYAEYSTSR